MGGSKYSWVSKLGVTRFSKEGMLLYTSAVSLSTCVFLFIDILLVYLDWTLTISFMSYPEWSLSTVTFSLKGTLLLCQTQNSISELYDGYFKQEIYCLKTPNSEK